jgi:2,3-bisphosphoglycerate-independent phosphoglycerate mutase
MKNKGPVVLCVVAGIGASDEKRSNALHLAETPTLDALFGAASTRLLASGKALGLPPNTPGSGEVGNLTLGAGRVVPTSRSFIDNTRADRKLSFLPVIDHSLGVAMYNNCTVHLVGLLSDAGVHSHMDHLLDLIDIFDFNKQPVVVHAILDGRDTPRQSAQGYIERLEHHISDKAGVSIGTVSGRHWAMDGDERWDRVYRAFHAIVRDKQLGAAAARADSPFELLSESYGQKVYDDRIEPTRIGTYVGLNGNYLAEFGTEKLVWEWTGLDSGVLFNFRTDRLRQLAGMFLRQGVPEYVTGDLLMDRTYPVRAFQ